MNRVERAGTRHEGVKSSARARIGTLPLMGRLRPFRPCLATPPARAGGRPCNSFRGGSPANLSFRRRQARPALGPPPLPSVTAAPPLLLPTTTPSQPPCSPP